MTSAQVATAVIIAAVVLFVIWRSRKRGSPAPATPEFAPIEIDGPPPDETVAATVSRLGDALVIAGEKSAHPRDMTDMPGFQEVVRAFERPEATLAMLRQYAFGANWPLSCAAFVALAKRPERNTLLQGTLAQLRNLRPWQLHYALGFLNRLEPRPAMGAPFAAATEWWHTHLTIPDSFREYLSERERLGDQPDFGGYLESTPGLSADHVRMLLEKIEHPFAPPLLDQLKDWQSRRIDREFLASFGRIWSVSLDEELLVEPEGWREQINHAVSAALSTPPRSVLVSGEPRIGKTAFLKLVAARLQKQGWTVFEAGAAELMADQSYIGQLEGRIRRLIGELDSRKRVAWYVMDLVQMAQSGTHQGQSATILDQISPAIATGRLLIFGEASPAGVARLLQLRPSLRTLIEICRLHPMTEAQALALAQAVAKSIEETAELQVRPETVKATMQLAQQYLGTGQLPGTVIELMKRAAANAISAQERTLTPGQVLTTLSQVTGLPRSILDDGERIELRAIKSVLTRRVIGQDEAVDAIVDKIAMLKAGLVDPNRPVGVFLFAGPTGTGKTELAKALAEFLFGSADRMVRLDMSEFQTPDSTAKILGSQAGAPSVDSLVDRVRKQPFCVILLDEFEKAHPNTWDLFLQIFDDGRLTDAEGRLADFRHSFIILTSNLGAVSHRGSGLGFVSGASAYSQDQIMRAISQAFRPEFVNRLDRVIAFRPLSRDLMRTILRKELRGVLERRGLRSRDWAVEWEESAIEFLLDRGFSPEMGARPLKRAIEQYLLAPLAATLVERRFPEGDQFLFVRSNGHAIQVEFVDPDADDGAGATAPAAGIESAPVSIGAMILRPLGGDAEHATLAAALAESERILAAPDWLALKEGLQAETTAPDIWARSDRHGVFARLNLMDRVSEAMKTATRLHTRLASSRSRATQGARELVSRLALQLHLIEHGIKDVLEGTPPDVVLLVEPALEAPAAAPTQVRWCARLEQMYRNWAMLRHMQIAVHAPRKGAGPAILQISGFGAYRTLQGEAGLHILDDPELDERRRMVARVKTVAGPVEDPLPAGAHAALMPLLAQAGESAAIVRRYRDGTAPLVRDVKSGWRSGRLDWVLDGNFDLIGALSARA